MVGITALRLITGSGQRRSGIALGASGNEGPDRQDRTGAPPQNAASARVGVRSLRHFLRNLLRIPVLSRSKPFGGRVES